MRRAQTLVKGDVVVVPFPFSDASASKRRPALVAASLPEGDVILCQVTSRRRDDPDAVAVGADDFERGGLRLGSWVRPARLFTADRSLVLYRAGRLVPRKVREVERRLCDMFTR